MLGDQMAATNLLRPIVVLRCVGGLVCCSSAWRYGREMRPSDGTGWRVHRNLSPRAAPRQPLHDLSLVESAPHEHEL